MDAFIKALASPEVQRLLQEVQSTQTQPIAIPLARPPTSAASHNGSINQQATGTSSPTTSAASQNGSSNQRTGTSSHRIMPISGHIFNRMPTPHITRAVPAFIHKFKKFPTEKNVTFRRNLIFFSEYRKRVFSSSEKADLMMRGRYVLDVEFSTNNSSREVREKLNSKSNFKNVLSIQIFLAFGKILQAPFIDNNKEIDGQLLRSLFTHKDVYVFCRLPKPKRTIHVPDVRTDPDWSYDNEKSFYCSSEASDDDNHHQEMMLPDDDNNHQDQIILPDDDSDTEISASSKPRTFSWFDEDGRRYIFEDVEPQTQVVQNLQDSNLSSPLLAFTPLMIFQSKRKMPLYMDVQRNTAALDLEKRTFSVLSELNVRFTDENAVGDSGPNLEFLSIILNALREDETLFKGDDFRKHLIYNAASLRNCRFFYAGQVIQLSLFNDGPAPEFFAEELFYLLFHEDLSRYEEPQLADSKEMATLKDFMSCTDVDQCNDNLRDNALFKFAGTLDHIGSVQRIDADKKIIEQDVIHCLMVERVREPLKQLKEGLEFEGGLLSAMSESQDFFKSLFCASPLTAEELYGLFSTKPLDSEEGRALDQWQRFLKKVQEGELNLTLRKVLFHLTSSYSFPRNGLMKPKVFFTNTGSFIVQTCFKHLSLPTGLSDEQFFLSGEVCMSGPKSNKFTTA